MPDSRPTLRQLLNKYLTDSFALGTAWASDPMSKRTADDLLEECLAAVTAEFTACFTEAVAKASGR